MGLSIYTIYFIKEFIEEIDSSINNNTDLNKKKLVEKLISFCFSEKFIPYLVCEFDNKNCFVFFISLFECKEKFASMEIIFFLFEELKTKNFDNKIIEINQIFTSTKNKFSILESYINNENSEDFNGFIQSINSGQNKLCNKVYEYINNNKTLLDNLLSLYYIIFALTFKDSLEKIAHKNLSPDGLKNITENIDLIIDNLYKLNSLLRHNNIYQSILFILIIVKNQQKLPPPTEEIQKNDLFIKYLKEPFNITNIKDKIIWIIIEKCKDSLKNIVFTILEGKVTEKEKFYYDFYSELSEYVNKDIKGITNKIYESVFYKDIIRIIKIDYELLKKSKISIEKIKKILN